MRNLFLLLVLLAIVACANKGNLSGGEKDESPPEILGLFPESGTTNFTQKKVVFQFDENIKLNDINNNLLISPPLKNKPKIKAKPKSFELIITDTLLENTTYTFNFGDAIQDLNEGNPISGYTYVFSTGDEIDSLTYSGTAVDAFSGDVPDDAWVILHKNLQDSAIVKERPYYLAKVDKESGTFKFSYLAEGEYKIYGLIDNNFNYKYDLPDESFAFKDSSIFINPTDTSTSSLAFYVQKDTRSFVDDLKNDTEGRFLLTLRGETDSLQYSIENLPKDSLSIWNKSKDSLIFWLPKDYTSEELVLYTQIGSQEPDTLSVKYSKAPVLDTTIQIIPPSKKRHIFNTPIRFRTKTPASLDKDVEISLLEDSLYVAGGLTLLQDSINPSLYIADNSWEYGKSYDIEILPGTLTDIYDRTNDTLVFSFQTAKKEELSTIQVTLVERRPKQYIIQLLAGSRVAYEKIVTKDDSDQFSWERLEAKSYDLRVIIDDNGNGQWDPGSFEDKLQPETVISFPDPVTLRPDWDTDLAIDLRE